MVPDLPAELAGRRIRVAVLCGGESPEHDVSLVSARNVLGAMDPERYDPSVIQIGRDGVWRRAGQSAALSVTPGLPPEAGGAEFDVVFPVLHGPNGEDGTVQGLLELLHVPYVGPGVLGAALTMDKEAAKRVLQAAGLPVVPWVTVRAGKARPGWEATTGRLGRPVFVKPARMGSSVGVSVAATAEELDRALEEAFAFDAKVLVEQRIDGREIECAVLGNEYPEASVPGEIAPTHDFYSYEAKYVDEHGARLHAPADLAPDQAERIREMSVLAFQALCCAGMARVDFFLTAAGKDGEAAAGARDGVYINEVNGIPGFTEISMYPRLWATTGLEYPQLIDRLISLAFARHAARKERGR